MAIIVCNEAVWCLWSTKHNSPVIFVSVAFQATVVEIHLCSHRSVSIYQYQYVWLSDCDGIPENVELGTVKNKQTTTKKNLCVCWGKLMRMWHHQSLVTNNPWCSFCVLIDLLAICSPTDAPTVLLFLSVKNKQKTCELMSENVISISHCFSWQTRRWHHLMRRLKTKEGELNALAPKCKIVALHWLKSQFFILFLFLFFFNKFPEGRRIKEWPMHRDKTTHT